MIGGPVAPAARVTACPAPGTRRETVQRLAGRVARGGKRLDDAIEGGNRNNQVSHHGVHFHSAYAVRNRPCEPGALAFEDLHLGQPCRENILDLESFVPLPHTCPRTKNGGLSAGAIGSSGVLKVKHTQVCVVAGFLTLWRQARTCYTPNPIFSALRAMEFCRVWSVRPGAISIRSRPFGAAAGPDPLRGRLRMPLRICASHARAARLPHHCRSSRRAAFARGLPRGRDLLPTSDHLRTCSSGAQLPLRGAHRHGKTQGRA